MLGGEVDDYAGSQLEGPEGKGAGVTIEISVKPHGGAPEEKKEVEEEGEEGSMVEGDEEHDQIAHILGMCGGGCAK